MTEWGTRADGPSVPAAATPRPAEFSLFVGDAADEDAVAAGTEIELIGIVRVHGDDAHLPDVGWPGVVHVFPPSRVILIPLPVDSSW